MKKLVRVKWQHQQGTRNLVQNGNQEQRSVSTAKTFLVTKFPICIILILFIYFLEDKKSQDVISVDDFNILLE